MYSLKSGVLKSFAPELNGAVDTLAASPDGKTLYVVGQFTKVGTAQRLRFAAFSVATGKLLALAPAFNARVRGHRGHQEHGVSRRLVHRSGHQSPFAPGGDQCDHRQAAGLGTDG